MKAHPTAVIDPKAEIGAAEVGPYCSIGAGVKLHDGVVLSSHVVVTGPTEIGAGTKVFPFAVLGGPPQHLGCKGEGTRLEIGADNVIREHVTMHRGTVAGGGLTKVGANGFFMAGSHVAHDCHIGDSVIFANNVAIGGHVNVGDYAFLGGLSAVHQHARIGEYAFVGGCAAVSGDVIPFASAIGNHARLVGLNVVGLKRRGFSREAIKSLRSAYKMLFLGEAVFAERIEAVRSKHASSPEVQKILSFIDAGKSRPLTPAAREE